MGKGKESPPDPECLDGASGSRETAEEKVLPCVSADAHLGKEYDPRPRVCHRTFRDYSQPVMPTRTIALPAVSKTLAQAPSRPAAQCASPGGGATTEKHRLLVRVRRRSLYESFDGGLSVSATIEMGTAPVGMVPCYK